MSRRVRFTKGHGTRNDFVLLDDRDGEFTLTATTAAALADRRSGIGGDGVIRVAPTATAGDASVRDLADAAPWFMDYRNADGSTAQMCGNGVRVFATYLRREGLAPAEGFPVATRDGIKHVRFVGDQVVVDMGQWRVLDEAEAFPSALPVKREVDHAAWVTIQIGCAAAERRPRRVGPVGGALGQTAPGKRHQCRVRAALGARPHPDAGARAGRWRDAVVWYRGVCGRSGDPYLGG